MWDDLDRFDVGGDIFTDAPVASGCRTYQPAALVDQVDRQAVDFELTEVAGLFEPPFPKLTNRPLLSRLISRCICSTGVNVVEGGLPTCWVGESGVRREGNASSSSMSWRIKASNSPSDIVGASST